MEEVLETVLSAFTGLSFVREGEIGSITRFGKAKRDKQGKIKLIQPGFKWMIPLVHSMHKVHLRKDSLVLEDLTVTLQNDLSYHYSAFVSYHVSKEPNHVEIFLYGVENPHELVEQAFSSALSELLAGKNSAEDINKEAISTALEAKLKVSFLKDFGVEFDECGLTSFTESHEAQQVNVAKAKIKIAETHYGSKEKIPEVVMAVCFGALPTMSVNQATTHSKNSDDDDNDDEEKVHN